MDSNAALFVGQHKLGILELCNQSAAASGLDVGHALAFHSHLADDRRIPFVSHFVASQDSGQSTIAFTLTQCVYPAPVPTGSAANAALVGANNVKGLGLFSVSTRPATFTAATSVV